MIEAGVAFLIYWFLVQPLNVDPIDSIMYTALACMVIGLLIGGVPRLRR